MYFLELCITHGKISESPKWWDGGEKLHYVPSVSAAALVQSARHGRWHFFWGSSVASSDKTHPFLEYYIHVSLEVLQKGGLGIYLSSLYSLLTTRQLCACVYHFTSYTVKLSKEIVQPGAAAQHYRVQNESCKTHHQKQFNVCHRLLFNISLLPFICESR